MFPMRRRPKWRELSQWHLAAGDWSKRASSQAQGPPDLGRGCGNLGEDLAVTGHKSSEEEKGNAAEKFRKVGEGLKESVGLLNAKQP